MSRTYKAIGINLKGMALGESDRLVTVLTAEYGLMRAIMPGARKHTSKIGARSGLFVVNELLIARGKSLDKIIQVETVESFPKLSQDLPRLTASQYLAELVLYQALSDQPQPELLETLRHYLRELERSPQASVLLYLLKGILHFLTTAGIGPEVYQCCLTQRAIAPDYATPNWQVGFSATAGGIIRLDPRPSRPAPPPEVMRYPGTVAEMPISRYRTVKHPAALTPIETRLHAVHLGVLQTLVGIELDQLQAIGTEGTATGRGLPPSHLHISVWKRVERALRDYAQYHLERPIQSAALMDACFPQGDR